MAEFINAQLSQKMPNTWNIWQKQCSEWQSLLSKKIQVPPILKLRNKTSYSTLRTHQKTCTQVPNPWCRRSNLFLPRVCQGPANMRRRFGVYKGAIVSIDEIDFLGTFFTSPSACKILQKANRPNSDGDMQFWSCRTMPGQRTFRSIQEVIVAAAMVNRWRRGDNKGLQARGRWRLRPLAVSFAGTWGSRGRRPQWFLPQSGRATEDYARGGGFSQPGIGVPMAPRKSFNTTTTRRRLCCCRAAVRNRVWCRHGRRSFYQHSDWCGWGGCTEFGSNRPSSWFLGPLVPQWPVTRHRKEAGCGHRSGT